RLGWPRASSRGVALGTLFAGVVVAGGWLVYHLLLRESVPFVDASAQIQAKVAGMGLDSAARYIALGLFYSLVHSLLEEYYWRWFVFGQLRRLVDLWPAIVISALGFTAHHVIVLSTFFGWWSWPA